MPIIEVTKLELEALIECVMESRINDVQDRFTEMLPDLHLKLEVALELWINGSTKELPIPPSLQRIGVTKYEEVYPPHPE